MNDVQVANPFGSNDAPHTGAVVAVEQSKAIAEVQAALLIARSHPRDPRRAMDRIIKDCMRASLAEEATYKYPRGEKEIIGASIRLAETIAKRWGNMEAGIKELSRANGVSECMAYAWDYETNYRDVRTFTVRHWRDTREGGYALKDERDIYEMVANVGARRKRACILALIDGDVVDAAMEQCRVTKEANVEINDERIEKLLSSFEEYGVTKEMIERRIERHIDQVTPAMWLSLREIYNALKDGMSAPAEWFDMPADDPAANVAARAGKSRTAAVKSRMQAKRRRGQDKPAGDAPTDQDTPPDGGPDRGESAEGGEAAPTYADIADAMHKAATLDALNVAADLARRLGDETQRNELEALFKSRAAELDKGGSSNGLSE
ncbi:hypothetical protein [Paraburkholderia adhaesiva]|uniref:hypothetical protein n=1 Tax=Paraburkholderia adhaesiva TaxID=2883244 RepID=UPI001F1DDDDB|nr:hypothetical protein [Paraburkholderia adhaesiva]